MATGEWLPDGPKCWRHLASFNKINSHTRRLPHVADMSRKWCKRQTRWNKIFKNGINYPRFSSTFVVVVLIHRGRIVTLPHLFSSFCLIHWGLVFAEVQPFKNKMDTWNAPMFLGTVSFIFWPVLDRGRKALWRKQRGACRTEMAEADWTSL